MSNPNEPTPPPSRIILPGADPEPAAERPRIILPPGAQVETRDDLPEYPRLRALQIRAVKDGERELIVITDPMGITPGQPALGMETVAILQMLDGTTSLADIQALFMRETKDLRVGNMLREFIGQLDEMLLLESPRYEAALAKLQAEWHPLGVRPATLEGLCYPAEHEELVKYLDEQFLFVGKRMADAKEDLPSSSALPRAIMAPHLDPRREGHVLARAYTELGEDVPLPLRIVVFGTGHQLGDDYVALTRKKFETPFGQVPCDTEFVDFVADQLGDIAYSRELVHRDEHSIEFQLIYLQRRLKFRRFTIVPILCGGFHQLFDDGRTPRDAPVVETLIRAVREAEQKFGGPTLYVAGVDFSHMGPRFGDDPLDAEASTRMRETDERAINAAATGDADAWFNAIAEGHDETRICGFAPTYCMLRCAEPGEGRPLYYAASPEPDGSVVTVAAMVWPGGGANSRFGGEVGAGTPEA